jgi:hypothetical protein
MNIRWIAFHLNEAREQIEQTLQTLPEGNYDEEWFKVDVQHMLHHIHTAYNSRNVVDTGAITEGEFYAHRRPPADLEWE